MPRVVVLRLHPDAPRSAGAFASYLSGLSIEAFDASFASPGGGAAPTAIASEIVQHQRLEISGLVSKAVATALIELPSPAPPEYAGPDLVLHVKRGGQLVRTIPVSYNVATVVVSPVPTGLALMGLEPVAAYVALPAPNVGPSPSDAVVDLPADGSPPSFKQLLDAVKKVLASDPGGTVDVAKLTPAQCLHVAREIAYNRHAEPLPYASAEQLEAMFTTPSSAEDENANARAQLTGALAEYRARHDARAAALAKYVFALSTAIACENATRAASSAGLRFPIRPGTAASSKIAEAEVTLES